MKRIAILSLAALVSCSEVPRNYPTYADRLHVNTSLEHYRCAVSQEEGERQLVELAATSDVEEGFLCFPQGWMEVGRVGSRFKLRNAAHMLRDALPHASHAQKP